MSPAQEGAQACFYRNLGSTDSVESQLLAGTRARQRFSAPRGFVELVSPTRTPRLDDLFGHWSMWQLQAVPAPRAGEKRRPDLYKLYCGPGDFSARGEQHRKGWNMHTRFFLCLSPLPQHFNTQRTGWQRSSSPMGAPGRGSAGGRGWRQAGAGGDDEPQDHPEDFVSRLSQPCQPFEHPAAGRLWLLIVSTAFVMRVVTIGLSPGSVFTLNLTLDSGLWKAGLQFKRERSLQCRQPWPSHLCLGNLCFCPSRPRARRS